MGVGVVGGGLGAVIITIIALMMGVDPGAIVPTDSPAGGVAPAEDDTLAMFVSVVLADTEDVWRQVFAEQAGRPYVEPDLILYSGITLAILASDAVETLLSELRRAKAAGKLVVFDPNIRPRLWDDAERMRRTLTDGARAASLVMPSFDDEVTHFGDASIEATIARYKGLGAANVVVKDGEKGVTLAFGDAPLQHVPATPVEYVVDTTSAGDSFNGAFVARLVAGAQPAEAAAFAASVAAGVIGHHGALVPKEKLPAA